MESNFAPTTLRARVRSARSFLLTPGARPERFAAARSGGGDGIMVDLESTVAVADKQRARDAALAFLREPAQADFLRVLRINSPHGVEGLRDLLALRESHDLPDALIIPKCESPEDVLLVADLLDEAQSSIGIVPMIELARAVFVAEHIASAHERVCGLFLGGGDLAADLGAEGSWENLLYARSVIVAAAATTGIAAIDVPYFKDDVDGLRREAMASRKLGMTGKAALRPEQLAEIDGIFTPSSDAVTRSRAIMAAVSSNAAGPVVLNGRLVEPAMVREAQRVLAIAGRLQDGPRAPAPRSLHT
jgi:(S)-citramalyl-CoA lyase